jgi:hypothetical protein
MKLFHVKHKGTLNSSAIIKHARNVSAALCFSVGILLAGSEGALWPYANICGILIFALTFIILKEK